MVLQPFTLSNGQTIPAGVLIELPSSAVNMDNKIFPESDSCDPWRFAKLRRSKASAAEGGADIGNQFASVGSTSLNFGFGRHVCPGRFFASVEIKMIVAVMLLNYDIALAEGETERYKNVEVGVQVRYAGVPFFSPGRLKTCAYCCHVSPCPTPQRLLDSSN